ncbi:MAG: hypothetical protein QXY40_05065, partial [Candidatus Methanomethylicia archaeon]
GRKMTPRVDKTTLSNLISLFLGRLDAKAALNELIVYIARQTGRREIPRDIAKLLLSDIRQIRSKCRNEEELREAISKYLVLLRWVYDSDVRNVDNIDRFMSKLTE